MRRILTLLTAVVLLLAGCATTIDGTGAPASGAAASGGQSRAGSASPGGGSTSPDFPSSSGGAGAPSASSVPTSGASPTSANYACPSITYAPAGISFTCITTGMRQVTTDSLWPLLLIKTVDSSGWALNEGASTYEGSDTDLSKIILAVRAKMVQEGGYLSSPTVTTVTTHKGHFGSKPAAYIQSLITLNPTAAKKQQTKVKQERLWILAVQLKAGEVGLWHVSLPDLAQSLWPKVPAIIRTIKTI